MRQDVLPTDPTLEVVKEHSLTSALKTELERLIFDGRIKAGERINESTLAAQFKTSRGPLREALQALGEQGLISFARNRGAYVRRMTLAEAEAYPWTAADRQFVEHWQSTALIGSPASVREQLDRLLAATRADELMVLCTAPDAAARRRSYTLLKELHERP